MSHYLDILLRPDPEIAPHQLMAALYSKLHLALVQLNSSTIGVSFPDYAENPASLGIRMRLCAPVVDLQQLVALPWLGGLKDHIHYSAISIVPSHVGYRHFRRVQAKSNPDRLRRRQIKRHGLTEEEALSRVPDNCAEALRLPFVVLRSASTAQTFKLFLRCDVASVATDGLFNTYGLSTTATTPWF